MTEASPAALKRTRSHENSHKKTKHYLNNIVKAPVAVGKVFVFGTGDTGQLGLGEDMLERKRPMPLKVLDDKDIVDIICGGMHSIAITKDGKVRVTCTPNNFLTCVFHSCTLGAVMTNVL